MNYRSKSRVKHLHVHINRVSPRNREGRTKMRETIPKYASSTAGTTSALRRHGRSNSPSLRLPKTNGSSTRTNTNTTQDKYKRISDSSRARSRFSRTIRSEEEEHRDSSNNDDELNDMTKEQLLEIMREKPEFYNKVKNFVQSKEKHLNIISRPPRSPPRNKDPAVLVTNQVRSQVQGTRL